MNVINTQKITECIKNLCLKANLNLSSDVYNALLDAYNKESSEKARKALAHILENTRLAKLSQRPLCQDTGMVVVLAQIGQKAQIEGELLEIAINKGVKAAYQEGFLRKSIVKDPVFERENTKDNTPAVIHYEIIEGSEVKLSVAIKGCGSENMSAIKMLKPSDGEQGIIDFVVEAVRQAGSSPCPPIRLGIGIGGNFETAALLSKKALLKKINSQKDINYKKLEEKIFNECNKLGIGAAGMGGDTTVFGVNILSCSTHIAAMPVAVNINCHSSRHASAVINEKGINYLFDDYEYDFANINLSRSAKKISTDDIKALRSLEIGEEVLLSGIIYTARDAAHKKLAELLEQGKELPFDIKDKIIYYTGPCPAKEGEIIGPAGPTTSARMDKYAPLLYGKGLLATIGKGERCEEVKKAVKANNGLYFTAIGGTAVLLSKSVVKAEVIAFEELGAEAVYRLTVKDFSVSLNLK